jgi:4-hydroxybenzoate polyprenyltransferase
MALTMIFIKFFLIDPSIGFENVASPLSDLQFIWLVATYIVIAAGGYAINDYYDVGMDEINRPGKTVLRNKLSLSFGQNMFFVLTAIGVLSGFGLAYTLKSTTLYFMPVFVAALFWFYTTKYKREFVSGNLVVAFLAFLNIGIVYIYYILSFAGMGDFPVNMFPYITKIVVIYGSFAFYVTFIREIVKDVVDIKGDKEFDCKNIAIRFGVKDTKTILLVLSFVLLAVLLVFAYFVWTLNKDYLFWFIAVVLIPMWIYFITNLSRAKETEDFKPLALSLKIFMVAGIVSLQLLAMSNQWR